MGTGNDAQLLGMNKAADMIDNSKMPQKALVQCSTINRT